MKPEVNFAAAARAGARFKVVNPAKTMLLHDAVLMIPQYIHHEKSEWHIDGPQNRQRENDHWPDDQALAPSGKILLKTIGAHPGGKVMRNGDPQTDRS